MFFTDSIRVFIVAVFLCLSLQLRRTVSRILDTEVSQEDDQFAWLRENRDVSWYVRPDVNTTLLGPKQPCDNKLRLLLLVTSAPGNREQRQAVRDTWGYVEPTPYTRLLFFVGHDGSENPPRPSAEVQSEVQMYGDIIVEDFIDSYHNLTLKTVFMLKWAVHYCSSVPFILKTDDDMLINVRGLLHELARDKYKHYGSLVIGRIQEGSMPYRDKTSKWYIPHWIYGSAQYPTFASGTGYVLTNTAMLKVYNSALETPLIPLEDVFLTGLVATKKLRIPLINVPSFHNDRPIYVEHPCLYHHLLTVHGVTPTELKRIWNALTELKPANCESLYARFLAYFFGTGQYEVIDNVIW